MELADVTYLFRWLIIHIKYILDYIKIYDDLCHLCCFSIRSLNRRMEAKKSFKNQGCH